MKLLCFCLSAFLLLCFFPPPALSGDSTTDAKALLAFKDSTGNKDNLNLASWSSSSLSSICTNWAGVACSNESASAQRVTALRLSGNSLSGQIPPNVLGQLDALQELSLRSNQFSGEFPSDLANCTSLEGLFLDHNNFAGPLSASAFYAWPSLQQVDLSFNNFNGSIPESITSASLLQLLNLQNNSFSGAIPPITTTQLQSFNVANNALYGAIPASLSKFSAVSFAGNEGLCGEPLQGTCFEVFASPSSSLTSSSTPSSKPKRLGAGAIAGIVIGSVGAACLLLLLVTLIARRKTHKRPSARVVDEKRLEELEVYAAQEGGGGGGTREAQVEEPIASKGEDKMVYVDRRIKEDFDLDGLLRAPAEEMGKGSLGVTFRAMLDNGLVVVVKRLNVEYPRDYKKRLEVLGKLTHANLVPIKAWYFFKDEKLLVYDYIPGTLYNRLYHDGKRMEWEKRIQVASTVANTIADLHSRNVVHGNIKAANVLMDSDGEAHITDYGLMPLAVNLAVKNDGYTPPELVQPSKATAEGDVYSFGVLLLELLTGRSPMPGAGRHNGTVIHDLPGWVRSVVREQWTAEVFDLEIMKFEYIQEEMMLLLQIALPCVSPSPDQRPSMATLVTSIENLRYSDDDSSLPPS